MPGPYPLATLGCTLNSAGITAPPYSDILASLQASAQQIFGPDVYLEPDSMDGQLLAVFAKSIDDQNKAAIATYNAYSPTYAQGAGLAAVVQLNGVTIPAATKSRVVLTISGTVGATITSGVASDVSGNLWDLPGKVVIPSGGAATVTATARNAGAVAAAVGTVTLIYTPTYGWQSVTNPVAAVPGSPVLTDAQVRALQAQAVALPAQSINAGIVAAVKSIPGVLQATLYDNDTDATDSNGIPAHSIGVVVEGGDVQSVVNAIGARITPGTGTAGTISGTYYDPVGLANTVSYYPLDVQNLQVVLTLSARPGFSSSTIPLIQQAVAAYIATLGIGDDVYLSKLQGPANLYGDAATGTSGLTQAQLDALSNTYIVTGVAVGLVSGTPTPSDYTISPFQIASASAPNVSITGV